MFICSQVLFNHVIIILLFLKLYNNVTFASRLSAFSIWQIRLFSLNGFTWTISNLCNSNEQIVKFSDLILELSLILLRTCRKTHTSKQLTKLLECLDQPCRLLSTVHFKLLSDVVRDTVLPLVLCFDSWLLLVINIILIIATLATGTKKAWSIILLLICRLLWLY